MDDIDEEEKGGRERVEGKSKWLFDSVFIEGTIAEHAASKKCSTPEYMNLYFKVKGFYFKYVADMPQYKASIPEFPAWVLIFSYQDVSATYGK